MTESATPDDRRPRNVALLGLTVHIVAFASLLGVSFWATSDLIGTAARFVAIGIPIWLVLIIVFNQIRRVGTETLETSELERARQAGESAAIFEVGHEDLLIERDRLRWMVRWLIPTTTVFVSTGLLVNHFLTCGWSLGGTFAGDDFLYSDRPTQMMWFVIGIGLATFLFGRWTIGLARLPEWRLLHAAAASMAGTALACLIVVIAMAVPRTTVGWLEPLAAYILRVGMLILGIEMATNLILDFYRPRVSGEVSRPAFDSRLLGMIGSPGGWAHSLAEAVNYQFGFEVSSSWFYQLMQRWLFPIMVSAFVLVLGLSSVVIVEADEKVIVERFGAPMADSSHGLDPGVHFKLPYPIDMVYRQPVRKISELVIGDATAEDDDPSKAILWTEKHDYVPELMLLVAAPKTQAAIDAADRDRAADASASQAISLLMVSVPIQYRIKDLEKYLYKYTDPVKVMEDLASQHLSDYAAGIDIDVLMGTGRETFNEAFQTRLQERLDVCKVGIEIVNAGIRGAHPPADKQVAQAFQGTITAEINKHAMINSAEAQAQRMLIAVAGTIAQAETLDAAIQARDALKRDSNADPVELSAAEQRVDVLVLGDSAKGVPPLSGRASKLVAGARARASSLVSRVSAKVRAYGAELAAYEAAPKLYQQRRILEMYAGLHDVRKYLIIGDASNVIIDMDMAEEAGLDRVLTKGLAEEQNK